MLYLIVNTDHEMLKALNTSKLIKKKVSVNRGGKVVEQMRWVRPDEAGPTTKQKKNPDEMAQYKLPMKDPEDKRGSKLGYGIHNITNGDTVEFKVNGATVTGKVVDDTRYDGVIVEGSDGKKHPVAWKEITNFKGHDEGQAQKKLAANGSEKPKVERTFVEPDKFTAGEWKNAHDDPEANPVKIIDEAEKTIPGVHRAINITQQRLANIEQTIAIHRVSGADAGAVYTPERTKLHEDIFNHFLSPEKIEAATPAPGEKPAFIMLGGRGGSGKSWFKNKVYDDAKCVTLDADEIKGMLPEYEGWNAAQVHEESSDILEGILAEARLRGLNVVLDATMKTQKSALAKVNYFKDSGYAIEAHYMHLPRQEAAKRAIGRFMGKTKRYVPVEVVLGNTGNEDTFDAVKKLADAWSFRDNNGAMGEEPVLISNKGQGRFAQLVKSLLHKIAAKGLYLFLKGRGK